jgi:hypothetical protein
LRTGHIAAGLLGLGCVLFLDLFADVFAKPTGCLGTDVHAEKIFEHSTRMAKWHPPPQLDEMPLLPRRQYAGEEGSFLIEGGKTLPTVWAGSRRAKHRHALSSIPYSGSQK